VACQFGLACIGQSPLEGDGLSGPVGLKWNWREMARLGRLDLSRQGQSGMGCSG